MLFSSTILIPIATLFIVANTQAIDPSTVPEATRDTWCNTQKSSCPLLCTQIGGTTDPESNDCDAETLNFSCVCSNGLQPNASEFSQTIPYFECTETANQCVSRCGNGDDNCVSQCRTAKPCGAQDPKRTNLTSTTASISSSSATASASQTNDYNGFGGPVSTGAAATTSASNARSSKLIKALVGKGDMLGMISVSGGLLAGFMLVL